MSDVRFTVLEIVNEVQRRLSLTETSLVANKQSVLMVDFINDICNDLSDYGNWQETLVSGNIPVVSGQSDYSIVTSAAVKNIGDIYITNRIGPLRNITIDQMRIMTRVTSVGTPSQFTVFGTDSYNNPNIRVRPVPDSSTSGSNFSIIYYIRAPKYSTSDGSVIVPFPGDVVVLGVMAKVLLNESSGSPTDHYSMVWKEYLEARKEALNRFKGDTGWNIQMAPSRRGKR